MLEEKITKQNLRTTVDSIYEENIALIFKERSTIIAGNFMRNLGLS